MAISKFTKGAIAATVAGCVLAAALFGFVGWFMFWVTMVDNYEMAFSYDRVTGNIETIKRTGWISRTPFRYTVHTIDLRPRQVSISANARILNAKLVQFNPTGLSTFLQWHGRDAGDDPERLYEILKGYAFDVDGGADCPFLTVVNTLTPGSSLVQTNSPPRK